MRRPRPHATNAEPSRASPGPGPRPRPIFLAASLAASISGCLFALAPSGVVGSEVPASSGRTRIAGAVRAGYAPADPALARSGMVQPPSPPTAPAGAGPGPSPAARLEVPAIPPPIRPGGETPLGSAPAEVSTAPAGDIRSPSIPPTPEYPIDLPTALRLAERENPLIGEVRARIGEALGRQQRARAELLPALNAGADYDGHAGNLQRSNGPIYNVSRQSVYFGGGAGTSAQNTVMVPAVFLNEPLTDALYDPLATHQLVHVARFDAAATTNAVLLEVARHYLELLGATARLEAERRSAEEAAELMRITGRYARVGEGRPSDFHRSQTEWRLRRAEVRRAEEDQAVASARLCRRLHLDPSVRIRPLSDVLAVLALVDLDCETETLIQAAIRRRPEIGSAGASLAAGEIRLRQEVGRPFLPSLFLGFSGAGFGGGSNRVPPLVGNFGGRTDFDVAAYWTLENLGFGNLTRQKLRRAEVGAAAARRARAIAMVREEVASALGDARARREQVEIARERLSTAVDGFRRDLERALQAVPDRVGRTPRPIEVINSLKLLVEARRQLVRTIVDYDQAQFRLFVAMGSPPPLEQPADPEHPAVPIRALAAPVTDARAGADDARPGPR